jgi:hypothetical protein
MEDDYRLVAARKLTWNENAWREPAFLALVISGLKGFLAEGPENPDSRAEAKYLIHTLYQAGKTPTPRNTSAH